MARENEEIQEAENTIAEMERKQRTKDEYRATLLQQIEETKAAIEKKRASKSSPPPPFNPDRGIDGDVTVRAAQRHALSQQQSKNEPELAFWEDHLGMRLDGAGMEDHLKITYTDLGNDRDAWVVVSMEHRDYEGTHYPVPSIRNGC